MHTKIASSWVIELWRQELIEPFYFIKFDWKIIFDISWEWKDWLIKIIKYLLFDIYKAEVNIRNSSNSSRLNKIYLNCMNELKDLIKQIQDYEIWYYN